MLSVALGKKKEKKSGGDLFLVIIFQLTERDRKKPEKNSQALDLNLEPAFPPSAPAAVPDSICDRA